MEGVSVDPILQAITANEALAAQQAAAPPELGREEFLKLLIAQLENQDPMSPAQDTEFVAQLATFSSLEQLITANDQLGGLALGQANLINAQALDLIGKEALVEAGDQIRIVHGTPEQLVFELPKPAQQAVMTIRDSKGDVVKTLDLETTPSGKISLDWDGTDAQGNALQDGDFTFEINATDLDGGTLSVAVFKVLPIEAITFGPLGIGLVSGDQEIPFDLILEIRAGQPSS